MRWIFAVMLAGGSLWAGDNLSATYVIGNIDGLSTGDDGSLRVFADQAIFRSGKTVITVPYSKITDTDLGPETSHPSDIPLYKIWQLHKRFQAANTTYRNLTLNFKDSSGSDQSLTLEIEQSAAEDTLNTIEIARGRRPAHRARDNWWGADLWRTSRTNADWDKRAADAAADNEIRKKSASEDGLKLPPEKENAATSGSFAK